MQAIPIVARAGTIPGGYHHIEYDGRFGEGRIQTDLEEEARLKAKAGYLKTTTARGHAEERVAHTSLPLRLELGVVGRHVNAVIHDLAWHETLIDVTRVLRDPLVQKAITETRGPVVYQQFWNAINGIAMGYVPARTSLQRGAAAIKNRTQLMAMGYNLWTAIQQPLGNLNAMGIIGPGWWLRGQERFWRDPNGSYAWMMQHSAQMRTRIGNATQDQADLRGVFNKKGGWLNKALLAVTNDRLTQEHLADSLLWHIGFAQMFADVPAWFAGYEKAMAAMAAEGPGAIDEAKAFALADQAVLDTQGSGSMKDLSEQQRGEPIARLFMTFYSYGNLVYNQNRRIVGRTDLASPADVTKMLRDLTLVNIAPSIATVLLSILLGKLTLDDDDDWWDVVRMVAGDSVGNALNSLVGFREVAGPIKQAVSGDSTIRGYEGPAGARILSLAQRLVQQISQGEADKALATALANLAGAVFGFPTTQVQRTIDGATALAEGTTSNPLALAVGPPKEKK